MYGSKLSVAKVAEILSENCKYDFNKSISDIKKYIMDLHLNKDYTKYTDINKIPNIKIEKGYKNGEAKFRFTDRLIYIDFNYKQYFHASQRIVKWKAENKKDEQFAYWYLKDKQLVISYKSEFGQKLRYLTIQDDYLNTREYSDFEPPRFTIYDDKNPNEITIDAWENRNNKYLDFDWSDCVLDDNYCDLKGEKVKRLKKVQIKSNIHLDNPIHINLTIPGCADNKKVLIYEFSLLYISSPNITISVRGVNKNGFDPILSYYCHRMFASSTSITEVYMGCINTRYVRVMSLAFDDCGIRNIALGCKLNALTDMWRMFYNCNNLESVTIMDTAGITKVTDLESLFENCPKLQQVCLNGIDFTKVTNMYRMFDGCGKLKHVICKKGYQILREKFNEQKSNSFVS